MPHPEPPSGQHLCILSGADVRRALPMPAAIAAMRDAFVQLSSGAAVVPVRQVLPLPAHHGRALFMPAYVPQGARLSLKAVTIHDDNPARGLPYIQALVLLFDAATGRAQALMDGEALTALRTGAASGLATDLLAAPDARTLALFGAGAQAQAQVEAVCAVRPIEQVCIFNRTPARAERLAGALRDALGLRVDVAKAPEQVGEADVVCTATSAAQPLFQHAHLKPGVHINAIGAYRPDMAELPPETVQAAYLVVDHRASCLAEAGDLIQPLRQGLIDEGHLRAELGEVARGDRAGRTTPGQITVFKSVGNAVQDATAAGAVYDVARAGDLGQWVTLS